MSLSEFRLDNSGGVGGRSKWGNVGGPSRMS